MPSGSDQERERFAAALEHGFDAVSMSHDDELLRELELVAMLRKSRAVLAPSADASARMRARVMAAAAGMTPHTSDQHAGHTAVAELAPRASADARTTVGSPVGTPMLADASAEAPTTYTAPVAQGEPTNVVPLGRAAGRGRHRFPTSQAPSRPQRGLLGIGAAAAVMVVALTGGGAMFSQAALPGDSLYGIKQTTESAVVGLTPGQGNKAQRQLDYAATRIDEAQKVNSSNAPPEEKSADISQALKGFDSQTESGSQMALANANSKSSTANKAQLNQLSSWAQNQSQRLSSMRASMPAGAQPDADHSLRVLEDVRTRAQSLNNRQGCDRVTSGEVDELGPVPAKGSCSSKMATSAPTVKSVVPEAPPTSSEPSESDSHRQHSSSSDSSDSREDSRNDVESGSTHHSLRDKSPLPTLPDLTGGDHSVLPDKDQDNGLLPHKQNTSSGLGLGLPLLPALLGVSKSK